MRTQINIAIKEKSMEVLQQTKIDLPSDLAILLDMYPEEVKSTFQKGTCYATHTM